MKTMTILRKKIDTYALLEFKMIIQFGKAKVSALILLEKSLWN
jgi:hypothetical protein